MSEPPRVDLILAMYVAEQYSLPARHEFALPDVDSALAGLGSSDEPQRKATSSDARRLVQARLITDVGRGTCVLTEQGRELGRQVLERCPRRRELLAAGRVTHIPVASHLDRYLRLSELLVLDAAQGRKSQWRGAHGFSTTDVDLVAPDPDAQRQESALRFRLDPLWRSLERRWKSAWILVASVVTVLEVVGLTLAFAGTEDRGLVLLLLTGALKTTGPFRGLRYTARLVHLLNPDFRGSPIRGEGYEPTSPFALHLREFRVERNQQLNALNSRWRIDPYERRIRRVLGRHAIELLGLIDASRREPPQFPDEAIAVADAEWETEVRRLVSRAAVVVLDLRRASTSGDAPWVTESVGQELAILRDQGALERSVWVGGVRWSTTVAGELVAIPSVPYTRTIWHVQPEWLTGMDVAFGLVVAGVAYVVFPDQGLWAAGYAAIRLRILAMVVLMAWRRRFELILERAQAHDHGMAGRVAVKQNCRTANE